MSNSLYISLVIQGFVEDPVEVTKYIGIHPDTVWRKGEKLSPRSEQMLEDNGWSVSLISNYTLSDTEFEDMLSGVLRGLELHADRISHYAKRGLVTLDVTHYLDSEANASFYASAPLLKRIGDLGIALSIDYINSEAFPEFFGDDA